MKKLLFLMKSLNIKLALVLLTLSLLLSCVSCGKKDNNADEINMLRLYVNKYFEEPEKLELLKLDKYEAENSEVYYHIKWIYSVDGDDTPVELLIVYSRARQMIELAFFGDMEAWLKRDIKEQWNKLKQAPPERVFTSEELSAFMTKVIE